MTVTVWKPPAKLFTVDVTSVVPLHAKVNPPAPPVAVAEITPSETPKQETAVGVNVMVFGMVLVWWCYR